MTYEEQYEKETGKLAIERCTPNEFLYYEDYVKWLHAKLDAQKKGVVWRGWVACDDSGDLYFYKNKPRRSNSGDWLSGNFEHTEIEYDTNLYNSIIGKIKLTWNDEPVKIELRKVISK